MKAFRGVVVALVTPFRRDGSVDLDGFRSIVSGIVEAGVHGLWVSGTTGEWPLLTVEERVRLFQAAVEASGGARVFAGVQALRVDDALALAREVRDVGVDYVFATPPLYFKPSMGGLVRYYSRIASAADLPVFIYNIPSHIGYGLDPGVISQLAMEIPGIAGVKATVRDYTVIGDLVAVKEWRRDFSVLSGSEELLAHTLLAGGDGAVSATGNIVPGLLAAAWRAWEEGDLEGLGSTVRGMMRARRLTSNTGLPTPIAVKSLLARMEAPVEPYSRPPLDDAADLSHPAMLLCKEFREYLNPAARCRGGESGHI